MTRLLITGSNGLLGQKLMDAFANPGDFPTPLPNLNEVECLFTSVEEEPFKYYGEITYACMDITEMDSILEVVDGFRPDVVLNLAAMTHVDRCENEPERCWKINVEAVANLADACEKYDARIIHISTDFIFDGEDGPYMEDDEPNPLCVYSRSKLASEEVLAGSDVQWSILRTCILYGVGLHLVRNNIVLWLKGELEAGREVSVVYDQYRSPTLAEDLASACLLAVVKQSTGIYHVSGKDIMSILEMAQRLAVHYGLDKNLIKPISAATLNQVAKRPRKTGFILDKAVKELAYSPHTFEQALDIIASQLAREK
ncbi:MAG: SDR family oxidoreductase [Flavobacteriales bacterium]